MKMSEPLYFGRTTEVILKALQLWDNNEHQKQIKMTRQEAYKKLAGTEYGMGLAVSLEALGLLKFDDKSNKIYGFRLVEMQEGTEIRNAKSIRIVE